MEHFNTLEDRLAEQLFGARCQLKVLADLALRDKVGASQSASVIIDADALSQMLADVSARLFEIERAVDEGNTQFSNAQRASLEKLSQPEPAAPGTAMAVADWLDLVHEAVRPGTLADTRYNALLGGATILAMQDGEQATRMRALAAMLNAARQRSSRVASAKPRAQKSVPNWDESVSGAKPRPRPRERLTAKVTVQA